MNQMTYQVARVLQKAVTDKKPKEIDAIVAIAITFLKQRRIAITLKELLNALELLDDEQRGVTRVTVTSKYPLTSTVQKSLLEYVRDRTQGEVKLIERIDPKVTGGFSLRYGSTLIDATTDALLQQLSLHLINQEQ